MSLDFSTLILGVGIWWIVFAMCFLGSLPLIGSNYERGENVAPLLWRIGLITAFVAFVLTIFGFWLYR